MPSKTSKEDPIEWLSDQDKELLKTATDRDTEQMEFLHGFRKARSYDCDYLNETNIHHITWKIAEVMKLIKSCTENKARTYTDNSDFMQVKYYFEYRYLTHPDCIWTSQEFDTIEECDAELQFVQLRLGMAWLGIPEGLFPPQMTFQAIAPAAEKTEQGRDSVETRLWILYRWFRYPYKRGWIGGETEQ